MSGIIFSFVCVIFRLKNMFLIRDKVKPLIDYVSGARFKSYPTRDEAAAAYKHDKSMGLVRIVRDPGDDEIYGPMFYAIL